MPGLVAGVICPFMKVLLRTGLGLFLAVVVLLVIVLCRTLTAPVQRYDAELVLPRVNIPQGSNAFDLLQTAASQVWWPKDLDRQTAKLAANTNWDDAWPVRCWPATGKPWPPGMPP